ncbi:collagen alpha-1(I) chain-like [Phoenix dactylifera]|uniref:Collagen alpha-1(I) chain-like n=1 Tax=Phoenix dactylifera TaxID=42345 RepID=A0A8B7CXE6_PHODC|nr:collagen alpha-1(I) chain-like [Phoenix dactylifera]
MELFSLRTKHVTSFLLYLSISSLLLSIPSLATVPSGTMQRTTKQQILATIPPNSAENNQPFLTSPSGTYTAYLLRRETAPAAGGFGNDFCYIQVQETASKKSMWESECAPVSTANACSLVFDDEGLEVFDGSESVWNGDGKGESFPARLDLVDDGDMRVIDKEGELFWRASDDPRANQGCGLAGSPGLAPESPPFSKPIGTNGNLPFGQQQQQPEGAPQPQEEQSQPVGVPPQAEAVEAPPQQEEEQEQQPVGAPQPNGVIGQQQQEPPVEAPQPNGVIGQQQQEPPVEAPQPNGVIGQQQQEPPVGAPQPNGVLGQQQQTGVQGPAEGLNGLNQPSDSSSDVQPLVDYNRYDSGSPRGVESWVGMCLGLVSLLVYGIIF